MKYIDADKLKVEIKGLQCERGFKTGEAERAYQFAIEDILAFINSLQQEPQEEICSKCIHYRKDTGYCYNPHDGGMQSSINENGIYECTGFCEKEQEQSSLFSNLEEAAEEYANKEHPDKTSVGQFGIGPYTIDRHYLREIAKDAFKEGVKVITDQRVSLGYLISWYIQSVDRHQPIWTEEHLKELDKDFILIPKSLNNH